MIPGNVVCQAPLSMGFLRQEYWSGLSFPSLGYLPDPGIKLVSPALTGGFFTIELPNASLLLLINGGCFLVKHYDLLGTS